MTSEKQNSQETPLTYLCDFLLSSVIFSVFIFNDGYPEIINEVKQLIGEDIILWGSSLFCKAQKTGNETPWHQDGEYWPIKPLESVTIWLAIDEVTSENGPLQYIPGSHLNKSLAEHETLDKKNITLNQTLKNIDKLKEKSKYVTLQPGMFSIHDVYLFHGSKANYSGKRRAGLTYRYMPATSLFDHEGAREIEKKIGYSLPVSYTHLTLPTSDLV